MRSSREALLLLCAVRWPPTESATVAGAVDAEIVDLHAAVRGVFPLFNRPIAEQIEHQFGEHLVHVFQVEGEPLGNDGR